MISKKYLEKDMDKILNQDKVDRPGEPIKITKPISVKGKLYRLDDFVMFAGELNTSICTVCSRCLADVEESISIDFNEKIYAIDKSNALDLIIEPIGEEFDFNGFVESLMELKLPMRFLCNDDCAGLCPICGTNLNEGSCDCNNENIDERLLKLKELLK